MDPTAFSQCVGLSGPCVPCPVRQEVGQPGLLLALSRLGGRVLAARSSPLALCNSSWGPCPRSLPSQPGHHLSWPRDIQVYGKCSRGQGESKSGLTDRMSWLNAAEGLDAGEASQPASAPRHMVAQTGREELSLGG